MQKRNRSATAQSLGSPRQPTATASKQQAQRKSSIPLVEPSTEPIIPPDVVLWASEDSDYLLYNPWYTTTYVGSLNVVQVVIPTCALLVLVLSPLDTTASRLLFVTTFAFGYVSTVVLASCLISPFTEVYLTLCLYVFLFHLAASTVYFMSAAWLLYAANDDDIFSRVGAILGLLSGGCHYIHGRRMLRRVFDQREDVA
ncbi:uncharacterized protein LOC135395999 [Ornithodoros turicata]|uniref:uncharacterized protein LOC135395999 n=1 Tax=Ornithodoros turicata TaxID=34597 RepID=UPI003138A160